MLLKAIIEDQEYTLNVPENVLAGSADFCAKLDADMDGGWQMSREWVQSPNLEQRCQIVADKLLSALEKENHKVGMLMAAYILKRLPNVEAVELDVRGEIQNNTFRFREAPPARPAATPAATPAAVAPASEPAATPATGAGMPAGLNRMQAMAQAGSDVTKVFKVGKAWRFSVYDHGSGTWQESPLIATEQEAERLRQAAFKERYEALIGTGAGNG
ncbi:MAG: hypothetical protein LJE69_12320 [Thiohalocapsa sp.]|jgi:hypothetical protein|uniref:hypothetical protein n=1 Tax=Thiohalocapsa sp. TaxID=2497641 RepID=UPI0025D85962|nr:hypothetical protein [Thiohalocapsa sp.]MCG6942021.1 hypothetical protein [Thiohalocapsa sp.]